MSSCLSSATQSKNKDLNCFLLKEAGSLQYCQKRQDPCRLPSLAFSRRLNYHQLYIRLGVALSWKTSKMKNPLFPGDLY